MRKPVLAAAMLALHSLSTTPAAADPVVSGGILTGATDVNIGGTLYDVTFVEGLCSDVFSGCNELADFTFTTEASALAAAQALNAQVFVDSPAGSFGADPTLTYGCADATFTSGCSAVIPYVPNIFIGTVSAINYSTFASVTPSGTWTRTTSTSNVAGAVWAVFSPAAAVPEPSTWAMMLLGFGGIGLALRRRRRSVLATAG